MITNRRHRPRHRLRRWAPRGVRSRLGLVLALGALAAGLVLAPDIRSASASSTHSIRPGLGYRLADGDFVGFYRSGGRPAYCLSPTKAAPRTVTLGAVTRLPGTDPVRSRQLAYALARWGAARTAFQAAVESQVLNTLMGNRRAVARRARHLPRAVTARVAEHVRAARELHGPYTVRVTTPRPLLPGQSAVGELRVRSAAGRPVPGTTVTLHSTANGAVPRVVRTDRHGVARFRYAVTGPGEVRVRAVASGLPAATLRASRPRSYEQLMVSSGGSVSAAGRVAFQQPAVGFAHDYACTTACTGRPVTRLGACAAGSRYVGRLVFHVGRRLTATITFAAAGVRVCRARTVTLHDGDRVTATWSWRTPHGWTRPRVAVGTFVVDCPPVPPVAVAVVYDCATARVTAALAHPASADRGWTPLVNRTGHPMQLRIGGAVTRVVTATRGRTAVFTATERCDRSVRYTVQAAVQRGDGVWNVGPVAAVVTPGRAAA